MPSNYPFWLGGVAASSKSASPLSAKAYVPDQSSVAASCTHPLDLIKVRMQTLESGSRRPSMISVLRASIAQSGIRNLYAGLTASLMRQMSYSLVRLGTYEELKARFSKDGPPSTMRLILAASLAGGLGGIAGNPADIILVRMTSDSIRPPEKRYGYRNALAGLIGLIEEEGVRGLARGLGPNTVRLLVALSFDLVLIALRCQVRAILMNSQAQWPARWQRSGSTSISRILVQSLREEGPRFLLKGWTPAFMRLGPNTILMFVFFEIGAMLTMSTITATQEELDQYDLIAEPYRPGHLDYFRKVISEDYSLERCLAFGPDWY
ncbi:hypothetical protein C0995_014194 [Termitomyces sp. Mi166|nr:hypothetical protein C0995_014194 [Termitomyces sp. Mi166\